jgi:aminopeptidase N
MKIFNILSVLLVLSLFSCDYFDDSIADEGKKIVTNQQIRESHSYSNISEIYTKHLHLDMEVDFDNNSIYGVARHTMMNKGSDTAVFDIKGLEIQKVTLGERDHEENTNFVIGIEDTILGAPLSVKIDKKSTLINIYYKTTDRSEALDWLKPEMTKGKKFPYLYTQGQAILTRTWVPSQDRPSNRITYSADVKVPEGMMALMSAKNPTKKSKDGLYHFEMNQPIPVYLIALAVGNLEYRKIGKNCGVYSEPEMIRQVAWEFKDLRKMIVAAEGIYGKYQWEQYDVIVLPYSFPFGGMENPRLTFANPTLLAGDRSLIAVIAHELAHSWSGNLVTNATWDDFWLNEGFTVYFENRIMESLYGKDIADILALIEFQELKTEVKEISDGDHPEDTYLKLSLDGRNPDDGMTSVAYVKGAFFLKTLEEKVGREKFDIFVKGYFKKFQFQTLTTEIFEKYLEDNLLNPNKIKFNTKAWLYGKGIPKNCIKIVSPRFIAMQKMADDFNAGKDIFKIKVKKRRRKIDLKREMYVTQEWLAFIRRLPRNISIDKLKLLDKKLDFKGWGNAEIATEWFVLGVDAGYKDIRPDMEKFLKKVGRRKFLLPIYKTLAKRPADLKWAKYVYSEARANYHAVSQNTIDEILKFKIVAAKD